MAEAVTKQSDTAQSQVQQALRATQQQKKAEPKAKPEPDFPVETFNEAVEHLRRPFTPEAVRWKVQNAAGNGAMVVGYIDARLVVERFNHVVGGRWWDSYEPVPGSKDLACRLTVYGVTRSDVGFSNHSLKGCYSDALKRAAVKFGVGVSLYAMQAVWLEASENPGKGKDGRPQLLKKLRAGKDKPDIRLTADVEKWLRTTYRKWLEKGTVFGSALDHGDVEGSAGSILDEGGESSAPVEQATLEADAAVEALEKLYEKMVPAKSPARKKLPLAKFKAQVRAAGADPAKLAALHETVAGLPKEEA